VPRDVLRILTWNVHDLLGDPFAVSRVLAAAAPDVACLQEVPRLVFTRRRLATLARRSGLLFASGGRAAAGAALLASLRAEVHEPRDVRLPVTGGWRARPRGYAAARLALPGTAPLLVASIHLGLDAGERADHVRRIARDVRGERLPVVLAGDLNESPGGPSWTALADLVRNPDAAAAPTFPARRPRRRIDAVLVDPRLEVLEYGVPPGVDLDDVRRGSDHVPVLATVRLPGR
jgi:endonuclease/exonuclease/phosphatase family metal-dependent hydrolase